MPGKKSENIKRADAEIKYILQKNIKKIRDDYGFTQQFVADALGIKRDTYCNYEDRSLPPQYLIYKLSDLYKVSPSYFYTTEELSFEVACNPSANRSDYSFGDLTEGEKLMILRFRQMKKEDRIRIAELISEAFKTEEE